MTFPLHIKFIIIIIIRVGISFRVKHLRAFTSNAGSLPFPLPYLPHKPGGNVC